MKSISHIVFEAVAALVLCVVAGTDVHALPLSVSDSMTFTTEDQGMWAPGTDAVVHKEFTAPIINVDTGPKTIGGIATLSTSIPNPAYLAWKVAYDGCRVAYSDSTCRNGATINLGFTKIRIPGLGNPPATTLTVSLGKNGLELTYDVDVEAGFKGSFDLDAGKVDVTYPTLATLTTDRDSYAAGELVTLNSFETVNGIPTMATEFSDIDTSLKAYADLDIEAALEAYIVGEGGKVNIVNVDTGTLEYELLGASVGNGAIDVRLLGLPSITIDTSGGIGVPLPKLSVTYPPCPPDATGKFDCPLGIPLAEIQLQVPNLDTAAPADSKWIPPDESKGTSGKIINTQLPIDRTAGSEDDLTLIGGGVGFHRTDVGKADVDIDGIISAASISAGTPVIFGLKAGIPLVVSLEGNLIDFDLGAFFGFGQTLTFEPTLMMDLDFTVPVQLESSPGVFKEVTSWEMAVGDALNFRHPGVDFTIDPTYFLDNVFTNKTDFLISPVASLAILQLKLSGAAPALLGFDFDAALYQNVFPLVNPIVASTFGEDNPFALDGFNRFDGSALFLGTAQASVPEPSALALIVIGLIMLVSVAGRRRRFAAG